MDTSPTESPRFDTVSEMDYGIRQVVNAAIDCLFDNHLVCILEISREKWVAEWLKKSLGKRCLLFHPHVLKIYDIFVAGDDIRVMFEHPRAENLLDFLNKFKPTERLARHLFQQLIFALECYHYQEIVGLDLALERVFYNTRSGVLKIIDFGFSDRTTYEEQTYLLPYVAPEQLKNPPLSWRHQKAADIWRCGVLLYCMLFRSFPFCPSKETSAEDQIFNILRARWGIPEGEQLSAECFHLLQRMLTTEPVSRISVSEIKNHPWYRRDLPDGVLEYEFLQRPNDGLSEKVEAIRKIWSPE